MTEDRPTSFSQLNALTRCEQAWYYHYVDKIKSAETNAMLLGTLVHLGCAAFWRGDDWRNVLAEYVCDAGCDPSQVKLDLLPGTAGHAAWLLNRYEQVYTPFLARVDVVEQELDLTATIDGTRYRGIIDEVWKVDGELWIVERKTYGRTDRLDYLTVDPQLSGNLLIVREAGIQASGIVFDGIYTYRWKAERPITDSFRMVWLDRSENQLARASLAIQDGMRRINGLKSGEPPLKSIGNNCKSCSYQSVCWESLGTSIDIQIEE